RLADKHNFPIIVFEEVVKFVDITQDLHSFIINQHHQILHQLNDLTKKFTELSLSPNGILKILHELKYHFQCYALFISNDVKTYYYPPEAKEYSKLIPPYIENLNTCSFNEKIISVEDKKFAITPVNVLGQVLGYLCLQVAEAPKSEFLFSVLDRAAISIAQILLRNRTIEERKLNSEDDLVQNLL